jgi:Zn-dependent peptidase ImmA (M78 family)
MKIPKEVRVGKNKITVKRHHSLKVGKDACRGCYDYSQRVIAISSNTPSGTHKYSASDKANTFWHELTHAILHDMKNDLSYDEKFVTSFSDRLDQAIKTARF